MNELQTRLAEAESASDEASKKLQELQAEQARISEALKSRTSKDFDELANLKRRQMALPEEVFTATIETRKAGLAALNVRREIAQASASEGVRLVGENAQRLQGEIEVTEKRLTELKIELSTLHSNLGDAQREAHQWNMRIAEAEDALRSFIQGASFAPASSEPKPERVHVVGSLEAQYIAARGGAVPS